MQRPSQSESTKTSESNWRCLWPQASLLWTALLAIASALSLEAAGENPPVPGFRVIARDNETPPRLSTNTLPGLCQPSVSKGANQLGAWSNILSGNPRLKLPSLQRTNHFLELSTSRRLAPGLYHSVPWSGLVLVPSPVDEGILGPLPAEDALAQRLIKPPLRLEPRK